MRKDLFVQTAFSITNVTFSANHVAPGVVSLIVDFQVHNNGPSHVAGLAVTTDFWGSSHIVPAVFQSFGAGFEFWHASFSVNTSSSVTFEFAVFCDDYGGNNAVPRIWNTNGGTRFQAHA